MLCPDLKAPDFWRYSSDGENRLTEASTRKQKVRYKYDALGRRVRRYTPGVREDTKFTNDGLDVIVDDAVSIISYIDDQNCFYRRPLLALPRFTHFYRYLY